MKIWGGLNKALRLGRSLNEPPYRGSSPSQTPSSPWMPKKLRGVEDRCVELQNRFVLVGHLLVVMGASVGLYGTALGEALSNYQPNIRAYEQDDFFGFENCILPLSIVVRLELWLVLVY